MKTINVSFFLLLIIILFGSCRKDTLSSEIISIPHEPDINVETVINGFITDRNGQAISGAVVSVINNSTQTNEFGFFEIKGLINEKHGVIKIEKQGYFNQFETIIPNKSTVNRTRIQLIEKDSPKTLSSNTGGIIAVSQNSSVNFQANSFVDEQGIPYNGEITIHSFYIDPTDPEIDQFMPGNLMARNSENDLRVLESFGMVNIELVGSSGQKLNISKPATLTVEVPNSILNTAPSNIPLWYFDESKGIWIEEGNATLQNNKYIGDVNHFTFWNCDVPRLMTIVQGQVNSTSEDLPIFKVTITNLDDNTFATSYTDESGYFSGGVPKNTPLLLEIFDLCGNLVLSENIGPFTTETADLGVFNISSSLSVSTISGVLLNCDANPISNGQIIISGGFINQATTANSDGSFTATITTCGNSEINVAGIDLNNAIVGSPQVYSVTSNMNIGDLIVCGNQSEGVFIYYNGISKYFPNCTVSTTSTSPPNSVITYDFVFEDVISNGSVVTYIFSFDDLNGDLNNPNFDLLGYFTQPDPFAPFTGFVGHLTGDSNFELLNEASTSGELMSFKFENMSITERVYDSNGGITVNTFENSSIIITGVLQ